MSNVTTVGIDLAKNVFSLHGIDANGAVVLRKTVSRARLIEVVAQQPACLIGLEACSGAHEWARRFQELGHTVKLMAPLSLRTSEPSVRLPSRTAVVMVGASLVPMTVTEAVLCIAARESGPAPNGLNQASAMINSRARAQPSVRTR